MEDDQTPFLMSERGFCFSPEDEEKINRRVCRAKKLECWNVGMLTKSNSKKWFFIHYPFFSPRAPRPLRLSFFNFERF
jgi:hypothetical protein